MEEAIPLTATHKAFLSSLLVFSSIILFLTGVLRGKPVLYETYSTLISASQPKTAQNASQSVFPSSDRNSSIFSGVTRIRGISEGPEPILALNASVDSSIDDSAVPRNYTLLPYPGLNIPVYAFIDSGGNTQYRIVHQKSNDPSSTDIVKVYPAMSGTSLIFQEDLNAEQVDPYAEDFGLIHPMDAPVTETRGLTRVWGQTGLYFRKQSGSVPEYLIYGAYSGNSPGWFPADECGNIIPGIMPVLYRSQGG